MEFDRMLMSDDFINPVRHLNTKHIHPTMRNAKIIAPFFEDVTPEEMQRSLKSMIFYHKLFSCTGNRQKERHFYGNEGDWKV